MSDSDTISIEYGFGFSGLRTDMVFTVELERESGLARSPDECVDEEWTRLEYCRCDICPYRAGERRHCPIAWNISGLAERFRDIYSIEEADIRVRTRERDYFKRDKVAQGLRSLLGLYLAASGCPHMDILRPMARFHLPFASLEETVQRHLGNYLMVEYFRGAPGDNPKVSLDGLSALMKPVDRVNRGICQRLENFVRADANRNALAVLNLFGAMISLEAEGNFDRMRAIYAPRVFLRADL